MKQVFLQTAVLSEKDIQIVALAINQNNLSEEAHWGHTRLETSYK